MFTEREQSKIMNKMKILFTLLSIEVDNELYINSAKRLVRELLDSSSHDILVSTNKLEKFKDIKSDRLIVRDNINKTSIMKYGGEFNYNLKYHAFDKLPDNYDCIVYLDCDVRAKNWSVKSDKLIVDFLSNNDFIADRLECILLDQIKEFKKGKNPLFSHKIKSFDILERYSEKDDIMKSQLPSEHFLIFKYDKLKLEKFKNKWEELNSYLQNKNGKGGVWGDGFEIGISARYAGYHKTKSIYSHIWDNELGLQFNGNKY